MIGENLAFLENIAAAELHFKSSKNMHIPNRGLYIPCPHSKSIAEGNEKVILKNRRYNISDMNFLYCDDERAYGILKAGVPKKIATKEEFIELRKYYEITDTELKALNWTPPLFVYLIKEVHNFDSPIGIDLPKGIQNFIVSPIQYLELGDKYPFAKKELPSNPGRPIMPFPIQLKCPNCGEWIDVPHQPIPQKCPKCGGEIWKEGSKSLIKSTALPKEKYEEIVNDYKLKPLPDEYYHSPKKGDFWAQMHIRGVTPEEYDDYKSKKIPLWKAIQNHSMHVDLRCSFPGLERLLQFVLVEDSIDSYIKVMKGAIDSKSGQVSKGLIVIKPSAMEPSERLKKNEEKGEMLLNEAGAKKVANLIIGAKSYWIEPGGIGATKDKWAYMGAIVLGKVESGTMREDFKELFLHAEGTNAELWNGRFIFKAFESPRHLWWTFKAIKTTTPCNPYCEIDSGNFKLLPAERLKHYKKEDYTEWKARKEKC